MKEELKKSLRTYGALLLLGVTGVPLGELGHIAVFPASHYVTPKEKLEEAIKDLEEELEQRVRYFEENGKLIEAQRIAQRTRYDIEMLQDLIVAATNEALRKMEEESQAAMSKLTGGLGGLGGGFPF